MHDVFLHIVPADGTSIHSEESMWDFFQALRKLLTGEEENLPFDEEGFERSFNEVDER